jgi:hypothetical protein
MLGASDWIRRAEDFERRDVTERKTSTGPVRAVRVLPDRGVTV